MRTSPNMVMRTPYLDWNSNTETSRLCTLTIQLTTWVLTKTMFLWIKLLLQLMDLQSLLWPVKLMKTLSCLRAYRIAQRSGIHHLLRLLNGLLGKPLKKALSSGYLPVFFYDVYKFMRLCSHPIKIGRRMP